MKNHWLDSAEDMQWLRDTHLKCLDVDLLAEFKDFKSAIVQGNMDFPHSINLYKSAAATLSDDFCRIDFTRDSVLPIIYSGITGEPRE